MLTRVEVRTRQGTLLNLPLDDVDSGYIIDSIDGLDPVKATLVTSNYANEDGEQDHGWRREARDIMLKISLEPNYSDTTVRSLRDKLYAYFMTGRQVFLRFVDEDDSEFDIVGRVESCEAPKFVKEPTVNVSVHCYNPDFVTPEKVMLEHLTVESAADPVTGMSYDIEIKYDGTVDAGIEFEMLLDRVESAFTIYNIGPDEIVQSLDFSAPMVAGDRLYISTVTGAKRAVLNRAGTESSVLYGVDPTSSWIKLQQGTNRFRVQATGAPIPFALAYLTRYGGL